MPACSAAAETRAAGDERAVSPGQDAQERQRDERGRPGQQLEARVGEQRVGDRPARGERAAEREAAHEDGQDHRHRGGGAAEDQPERAQPERLVDERRGPGERDEERQGARGGGVRPGECGGGHRARRI